MDAENHETEYSMDVLPAGATLTDLDGNPLELGKRGVRGFVLTFDQLPAGYTVKMTYVTVIDRDLYVAAGGKDGDNVSLWNDFFVKTADGNGGGIIAPGHAIVKETFGKKGTISGKIPDGNPILVWTMDVNLTDTFTVEELKNLTEVLLTDDLNPVLKLIDTSVAIADTAGNAITPTWRTEGNQYVATTSVVSPVNYSRVEFDNTRKPKLTDFTVTKVWDDQENAAGIRPKEITVHLYQDGQPYNNMMVTLNESNNWTYTWTDLPEAGGEYSAVEDPIEGYEGSAVTADGEIILTNKISDQPDKPDHPTNPGKPGRPHKYHDSEKPDQPTQPNIQETPGDENTPTNSTKPDITTLPKTGQLWWPVLILLILGLAMAGRGIYMEKKHRGKHEK